MKRYIGYTALLLLIPTQVLAMITNTAGISVPIAVTQQQGEGEPQVSYEAAGTHEPTQHSRVRKKGRKWASVADLAKKHFTNPNISQDAQALGEPTGEIETDRRANLPKLTGENKEALQEFVASSDDLPDDTTLDRSLQSTAPALTPRAIQQKSEEITFKHDESETQNLGDSVRNLEVSDDEDDSYRTADEGDYASGTPSQSALSVPPAAGRNVTFAQDRETSKNLEQEIEEVQLHTTPLEIPVVIQPTDGEEIFEQDQEPFGSLQSEIHDAFSKLRASATPLETAESNQQSSEQEAGEEITFKPDQETIKKLQRILGSWGTEASSSSSSAQGSQIRGANVIQSAVQGIQEPSEQTISEQQQPPIHNPKSVRNFALNIAPDEENSFNDGASEPVEGTIPMDSLPLSRSTVIPSQSTPYGSSVPVVDPDADEQGIFEQEDAERIIRNLDVTGEEDSESADEGSGVEEVINNRDSNPLPRLNQPYLPQGDDDGSTIYQMDGLGGLSGLPIPQQGQSDLPQDDLAVPPAQPDLPPQGEDIEQLGDEEDGQGDIDGANLGEIDQQGGLNPLPIPDGQPDRDLRNPRRDTFFSKSVKYALIGTVSLGVAAIIYKLVSKRQRHH